MLKVVLVRVALFNQDFILRGDTVPASFPGFVGLEKAEREIRTTALRDLVDRALQQTPSMEPIVVVAETVNSIHLGQLRLCLSRLG